VPYTGRRAFFTDFHIYNHSFASAKLSFHLLFAAVSKIETFKVSKPQKYQFEIYFQT
jgi:hypothetical protein